VVSPAQRRNLALHRSGVVLVDVIVATILLGISLTAIVSMTGRALLAQHAGEQFQTAAMLLDEQLNLVLARGPDDYASHFDTEGVCEEPYEAYRYKLEFSGGEGGDAYRVVATVTWTNGNSPQSATVETMIAPRLGDDPDPDRRPDQPAVRGY
jgi:Tfp pilus assembly protein PilV